MSCAFVDASAFFSGIQSKSGAMRELLRRHRRDKLTLVVSIYVVEEVRNTLQEKAPQYLGALELLIDLLDFDLITISQAEIKQAATYTELKDAPIVAAAQASSCDYLLTYDRKHLIDPPEVSEKSGLEIITPGDLLQKLRHDEEE